MLFSQKNPRAEELRNLFNQGIKRIREKGIEEKIMEHYLLPSLISEKN